MQQSPRSASPRSPSPCFVVELQTASNIAHSMQQITHNTLTQHAHQSGSSTVDLFDSAIVPQCPAIAQASHLGPSMDLGPSWTSDLHGPRTLGPSDAVNSQPDDPYQIRCNLACIFQEISGKWPKYSSPTSTTGGSATGGSSSQPGAGKAGAAALLPASSRNARAALYIW